MIFSFFKWGFTAWELHITIQNQESYYPKQSSLNIFITKVQVTKGQPVMWRKGCWYRLLNYSQRHRSSLLSILIPFPSLILHTLSSDTFPLTSVLNTVWSCHLSFSCYLQRVRQTHRAAVQMPGWEHVTSTWWLTGCLLHLVFHYSFIRRTGATTETRRRSKSHFPHGPSWHRFQVARISLEYYSSWCTSAITHSLEGHPQPPYCIQLSQPTWLE